MNQKRYNLFLDDERFPKEVNLFMPWHHYKYGEWIVVRNYNDFCRTINEFGLPYLMSFDHDIADFDENGNEKTGMDCAKFMVEYHLDHIEEIFPMWLVHSRNEVGVANIVSYLSNYEYSTNHTDYKIHNVYCGALHHSIYK